MKSIYFFSSKLRVYLTELPMIIFLILSIAYNDKMDTRIKLYPLIIALSLLIIFTFIYFLRFVKISTDEVRCSGLFSSRDRAVIKKDKRLVLTLMKKRRILIEIFGIGEAPTLDWVDPNDYVDSEINLFRTKSVGGKRAAKRLLSYFDIDKKDFDSIIDGESFKGEYEFITLISEIGKNGKEISLKFNETI